MAPDRSSRETEICRQRTSGGGADSNSTRATRAGAPVVREDWYRISQPHCVLFPRHATPLPARATSLCNYAGTGDGQPPQEHLRGECRIFHLRAVAAVGRIVTRQFFSTAAAFGANSTGTS